MAEGRMAYGWPAMLAIIFVVSLLYILLDPFVNGMYEAALQINTSLHGILDYMNLLWTWMPLAFAFGLILWAVNMSKQPACRPDPLRVVCCDHSECRHPGRIRGN